MQFPILVLLSCMVTIYFHSDYRSPYQHLETILFESEWGSVCVEYTGGGGVFGVGIARLKCLGGKELG